MQEPDLTSNLIYGCDIISKRLRFHLSPMGGLFQFNKSHPKERPRPLTLLRVFTIFVISVLLLIVNFITVKSAINLWRKDERMIAITRSAFLNLFGKIAILYQISIYLAIGIVTVAHHCSIANVIATKNYIINEEQQSHLAKMSITVILVKIIISVGSLVLVVVSYLDFHEKQAYLLTVGLICILLLNLTVYAPVIYTCYLGAALGKHVENFSEIYIDTMFDQFMNAIEAEDSGSMGQRKLSAFDGDTGSRKDSSWWCCGLLALVRRVFFSLYLRLRSIAVHLNARKYPELPEMKMTKLSSTTNIKMSDAVRVANSQLIRTRLRKTQIMLSELRDMVNDINKMSSPIIMMLIIKDTLIMIAVTMAPIQAKLYKSINILIIPSVAYTLGIVIIVGYVCICLDETSSQLKLLTNKLFDFIIMNHRVQSQSSNKQTTDGGSNGCDTCRQVSVQGGATGAAATCGSDSVEEEALSETWSQFQYTRKLANTIQFTMGGILSVTRRLALPILGHILSAVFISIEVMSIIDTSVHEDASVVGGVGSGTHGAAE